MTFWKSQNHLLLEAEAQGWGFTAEGHRGTFWGCWQYFVLCDGGYMTIYICQNSELYIKRVNFTACGLYLSIKQIHQHKVL